MRNVVVLIVLVFALTNCGLVAKSEPSVGSPLWSGLAGDTVGLPVQSPAPQDSVVLCVADSAGTGELRPVRIPAQQTRDDSDDRGASRYRAPMELHPSGVGYAADSAQFSEPWIKVVEQDYGKTGPPRPIEPRLLVRIGERRGASVFMERGTDIESHPEIVYLLTPECRFLPYRSRYWIAR